MWNSVYKRNTKELEQKGKTNKENLSVVLRHILHHGLRLKLSKKGQKGDKGHWNKPLEISTVLIDFQKIY